MPPTLIHRSEHVTDAHHGGRDFTREIRNWKNYKTPAGLVLPTNVDLVESSSPPPGWEGDWDFDLVSEHGAGQAFIREHARKLPQAGLRHSDYPQWWLNLRVLDTADGIVPVRSGNSVTWPDAFTGCDLTLSVRANGFDDEFCLKSYDAPTRYRYSLLLAPHLRHVVTAGSVKIYDEDGDLAFEMKAPWARDSSGDGELGAKSVRCWFEDGEPLTQGGRTFPTLWKCIEPTEFAAATLPVRAGPTTTVSGVAAIDDTAIMQQYPDTNSGGLDVLHMGVLTQPRRELWRCATASIPAGTIGALRLNFYRFSEATQTQAGTLVAYFVADANAWVEGTALGVAQNGSPCWNYAAYDPATPTNWAGSAGLSTSGTDYDTDASPPSLAFTAYTVGADTLMTLTLRASWATAWRDATRANNGFLARVSDEGLNSRLIKGRSTEYATDPTKVPYFEIDYTAANPPAAMHYYRQMRR